MSTTANEKFIEAVRAVGVELRSLSREEFAGELKRREDGDIARMLSEIKCRMSEGCNQGDKDGS